MGVLSRLNFYSFILLILYFGSIQSTGGVWVYYRPTARQNTNIHLILIPRIPDEYLQKCDPKDYIINTSTHHLIYGGGRGVFDYRASQLCVYDTKNRCIQNYKGSFPSSFILSCSTKFNMSAQVTGLAIDWVSNLCYWSDATYRRIGVVETTSFKYWKPVIDTQLISPQDVVIYPKLSYLFWIDGGDNPKIEKLDLVNNIRNVLISKETLQQPMALVIDFTTERLLWLDSRASKIGSINFDGSNPTLWDQSMFRHTFMFALYKEFSFFFTDGEVNRTAAIYNYTQKEYLCDYFNPYLTRFTRLRITDDELDSLVKSPCSSKNGGCEHFCTAINTTSVICSCAIGFVLDSNATTCMKIPEPLQDNFLLVTDRHQRNILQVDLENGDVISLTSHIKINSSAVAYNPKTGIIYFINNYAWSSWQKIVEIRGIFLISGKLSTEIQYTLPDEGRMTGLAIDFENESLYFSVECGSDICRRYVFENTSSNGILNVPFSLDKPNVVFSDDQTEQVAIALDVGNRLIFWSECGSQRKSIEQGQIENPRNHKSIVSNLDSCATAIAIDSSSATLYWGEKSGSLYRVNLNGDGKSLIHEDRGAVYSGLALDDNYLYISDSNKSAIQKLDRKTNKVVNMTSVFIKPYGITLYNSTMHKGMQKRTTAGPDLKSRDDDKDSTFRIAALVCVSIIVVAIIATVGYVIAKKTRSTEAFNQPNTYEPTLGFPDASAYDEEHYDTIDFSAISTEGYCELSPSKDSDIG